MRLASSVTRGLASAALLALALVIAGCGSSSSSSTPASTGGAATQPASSPSTLALTISESGKSAKLSGPTSVRGGLVTVTLTNTGKAPHGAQFVRIIGNHTAPQALMALGNPSGKSPSWLHADGGVGTTAPGANASATSELPAGNYAVVDLVGAQSGSGGPPAFTTLTVTPGPAAAVPMNGTAITAAAPAKDRYKWTIGGPLKSGANTITLISKGKQTLHLLAAFRITGKHSNAELVKAFESNGPPPSYVDLTSGLQTGALDGGKSLNTQITFAKPGTYVLFCPLHDRDGGKPHFAEGLITTVSVN